jgi:hypothetical protein
LAAAASFVLSTFSSSTVEGAVEDRARIAVRDLAAEQRLRPPQSFVGFLAEGELDAVALRCRGLDDRARCRRQR